jgi:hypothetical protein
MRTHPLEIRSLDKQYTVTNVILFVDEATEKGLKTVG